jgi:hypothetical protein
MAWRVRVTRLPPIGAAMWSGALILGNANALDGSE